MVKKDNCRMCGAKLTLTIPHESQGKWFCSLMCAQMWRTTYKTSIYKQILKSL